MSKFFVHESSYIDDNVEIGEGTKIWYFCHVQKGAKIGKLCSLGQNVNISNNVKIGNGVKIQNNVSVYEGVELEDYVFCGPSCVFTNDLNPRAKYPKGKEGYNKTLVKTGASIGANANNMRTYNRKMVINWAGSCNFGCKRLCLMKGVPQNNQVGYVSVV